MLAYSLWILGATSSVDLQWLLENLLHPNGWGSGFWSGAIHPRPGCHHVRHHAHRHKPQPQIILRPTSVVKGRGPSPSILTPTIRSEISAPSKWQTLSRPNLNTWRILKNSSGCHTWPPNTLCTRTCFRFSFPMLPVDAHFCPGYLFRLKIVMCLLSFLL